MPFVERDEEGKVIGRYANLQPETAEEWLDDGHPDLVLSGHEIPQTVTMRQARLALLAAGHLPTVNEMMAQADDEVQIEWQYADLVRRDHPMVTAMGQGLGLSEEEVDQLFIQAAAIP